MVAEIRSANSVFSLTSASYAPFNIDDCVDATKRYHQIRLTFKDVTDIRDLRVHSVTLRGLYLNNPSLAPPGLEV